jgi:ornithine decarboxylase
MFKKCLDIIKYSNNKRSYIIYNSNNVIQKIKQWKQLLPIVEPFYAVKCNPNINILYLLNKHNINFDCASKDELKLLLKNDIRSNRIIFANPSKMIEHLKYAKSKNVNLMTFDSIEELNKIKTYYHDAKLLIRIKVDDSKSLLQFNKKFGIDVEEVKCMLLYAKLLNLNVVGCSFHIGSRCTVYSLYEYAIYKTKIAYDIAKELNYNFSIINVGGGFSGTDDILFKNTANTINNSIKFYYTNNNININFMAEPGRYFVESAYTIVATIINKKKVHDTFIYYISEGVYGTFNNILTDKAEIKINTFRQGPLYRTTIFGPSCDSLDCIATDVEMPELFINDTIYVENMGAYTTACATKFNGFKPAEIKYIL